jgi:hypothetical protein
VITEEINKTILSMGMSATLVYEVAESYGFVIIMELLSLLLVFSSPPSKERQLPLFRGSIRA